MDAAEDRAFGNALAGLGDLVEADGVIDHGVFVDAATAEVANDFADDAGVALSDATDAIGLKFDRRRGLVQLFIEDGQVCALRFEHEAPAAVGSAGFEAIGGVGAGGFDLWGFACEDEEVGGAFDDEVAEIVWTATLEAVDGFFDFDPIACGAAERDVHGVQESMDLHAAFGAEVDHGVGEFAGLFLRLHEGGAAIFDVKDQGLDAFGEFLGQDGRSDERDGWDGACDVTECVKAFVSGRHFTGLAANDAADGLHLFDDAIGCEIGLEAGDGFEFIERAAGDAEAAAGDHWDAEAEFGKERRQGERDFVADAAGGVLVDERAWVGGEAQGLAGVAHGEGPIAGFARIEAAEVYGHEERSHLVVGDFIGCEVADDLVDLVGGECLPVSFRFEEGEEVHVGGSVRGFR